MFTTLRDELLNGLNYFATTLATICLNAQFQIERNRERWRNKYILVQRFLKLLFILAITF